MMFLIRAVKELYKLLCWPWYSYALDMEDAKLHWQSAYERKAKLIRDLKDEIEGRKKRFQADQDVIAEVQQERDYNISMVHRLRDENRDLKDKYTKADALLKHLNAELANLKFPSVHFVDWDPSCRGVRFNFTNGTTCHLDFSRIPFDNTRSVDDVKRENFELWDYAKKAGVPDPKGGLDIVRKLVAAGDELHSELAELQDDVKRLLPALSSRSDSSPSVIISDAILTIEAQHMEAAMTATAVRQAREAAQVARDHIALLQEENFSLQNDLATVRQTGTFAKSTGQSNGKKRSAAGANRKKRKRQPARSL